MTCHDCTTASQQPDHWGTDDNCQGCRARSVARVTLRKGSRGLLLQRACEQAGVTVDQVREAWRNDAMNKDRPT